MTSFAHVADDHVRAVLTLTARQPGDIAKALLKTLRHIHADSVNDEVPAAAVETRAKGYIAAEDAFRSMDLPGAVNALRAVWGDAPVTRLVGVQP